MGGGWAILGAVYISYFCLVNFVVSKYSPREFLAFKERLLRTLKFIKPSRNVLTEQAKEKKDLLSSDKLILTKNN